MTWHGFAAATLFPGETRSRMWARRSLTFPGVLLAFLIALGTAPIWALSLTLWDQLAGDGGRFPRLRCGLLALFYLSCEVLGLALAAALWLSTLGGALSGHARYRAWNFQLQAWWCATLFQGLCRLYRLQVKLENLDLGARSPYLLLVRHASLADTLLASTFLARPHGLGLRYVLKRELLWNPCLDLVGRRLPNHFLDRSGKRREQELAEVSALTRGLSQGEAILIYPEGTRFSPSKLERALSRLSEGSSKELLAVAQDYRQVLPPRPGGFLSLRKAAPDLDVVFLAHTGLEEVGRWSDFWSGALIGQTLQVGLKRIPGSAIPEDKQALWLYQQWADLDQWIALKRSNSKQGGSVS